jgi:predicted nucleic acid-binding Zn ribbon protein
VRRAAPRPISIAVDALGARLAPQSTLTRVQSAWGQLVGAEIAANARPTAERDGVLTVLCSAAVWAAELEMRGEELTELLNADLAASGGAARSISRIRFRVG